jgi:hypothetical protein
MTKTNGLTAYQIKDLNCDVESLKADVKTILTNHLPHLHEEIQSLKVRVNALSVVNVAAIVAGSGFFALL